MRNAAHCSLNALARSPVPAGEKAFATIGEVPLNRLLKYLNVFVAVVFLAVLGMIYWFGWRVLPKTTGEIAAPIGRNSRITRDNLGVPHIQAQSLQDLYFLQGYVTAQDRLWQMEMLRRYAGGELAGILGPDLVNSDRDMRRLRMRRLAEENTRTLDANIRPLFAAYARGVNHFIESHGNALPVEFTILRFDPRPWSVTDCVLLGLHMFRELTSTWRNDLQKYVMLRNGDRKLVNELFPVGAGEELPGSNAWAISGKLTASGKPILANDTHLEYGIPTSWYMIHLSAPGMNVAGVSLPGLPAVIIGHNQRIAWGLTNLQSDVQDLYLEKFNPRNGQYLFRGEAKQARAEREVIPVRGREPVEQVTWVTQHGPLWTAQDNQVFFIRWVAAEPGAFAFPFFELNAARDWGSFRDALRGFAGPAQNFVYVDVDGNIGYQVAGRLPLRRSYSGDEPVDGSSGEFEWEGFIPFEELPSALNPASGMVVTANQDPFPRDYPYRVNGSFAPGYRAGQIRALLRSKRGWKPEDMLAVQKDVYSPLHHFLARQVVAAYDARGAKDGRIDGAVSVLRAWNGQMEKDQGAALLASLLYNHLRRALAERAAPGKGAVYESRMAGPVLERLLRTRPKYWFADFNSLLLRAFLEALEEGTRLQGRDPAKWNYGAAQELVIRHPVGNAIPYLNRYFNLGPVPMSGSVASVKQVTRRIGPAMRFVADASDWEKSLLNIATGESGQVLSPHYKDQWEAHYVGRGLAMPFAKIRGDVLNVTPLHP